MTETTSEQAYMNLLDKIHTSTSAILREAGNARRKIDVVRQALRDTGERPSDEEMAQFLDKAIESLDMIGA